MSLPATRPWCSSSISSKSAEPARSIWPGSIPSQQSERERADTVAGVKIGELAESVGVTTKTVRYYESIGVLDEPPRTPSGYRDYSTDAVARLDFVRQAQATGLSLDEIRSILAIKDSGGRSCEHTRALLQRHLDELDAKIAELQVARRNLRAMYERAASLDPSACTDANSCQVISDRPG